MRTPRISAPMLVVIVVALLGLSSSSALAKAPKLVLEANGQVLPAGAPLEASNSTPWVLQTTGWSVSCGYAPLSGTVTSNGTAATPTAQLTINTLEQEPGQPICASTFAPPLDEVLVTRQGTVPWPVKISKKGALTAAGVEFNLKPAEKPAGSHPAEGCKFTANVKLAIPINGEPIVLAINSPFGKDGNRSKECGTARPQLTVTYPLMSGGSPVSAVIR